MKKSIILFLSAILITAACKKNKDEDPEPVVPGPYDNITVLQSQQAFVLISTATWCSYCGDWGNPTFKSALEGEGNIDAARVNGMALHFSTSDPMYHIFSKTLKDEYGIGGPPNLWIEFDNTYKLQPTGWKNAIVSRQAQTNVSCGIGMAKETSGGSIKVKVKVKFFSTLTGRYNLAVYAVENNVTANQSGSSDDKHLRVLRGEIAANNAFGTQIFNGTSPEEYTNTFTFTPQSGVVPSNVQFVAVVYKMVNNVPVESPNSKTL
jgi:hypothetical protein